MTGTTQNGLKRLVAPQLRIADASEFVKNG